MTELQLHIELSGYEAEDVVITLRERGFVQPDVVVPTPEPEPEPVPEPLPESPPSHDMEM